MGQDKVRLKLDGLLVILKGLLTLPGSFVSQAPVVMGDGVIGKLADGLAEFGNGLVIFARVDQRASRGHCL